MLDQNENEISSINSWYNSPVIQYSEAPIKLFIHRGRPPPTTTSYIDIGITTIHVRQHNVTSL